MLAWLFLKMMFTYVVGGFDGHTVHRSVEMFNSKTSKWKFIPPMKQKRSGVEAAVLDKKLYVVGGWDGQNRMQSGEVYNPAKRQWEDARCASAIITALVDVLRPETVEKL